MSEEYKVRVMVPNKDGIREHLAVALETDESEPVMIAYELAGQLIEVFKSRVGVENQVLIAALSELTAFRGDDGDYLLQKLVEDEVVRILNTEKQEALEIDDPWIGAILATLYEKAREEGIPKEFLPEYVLSLLKNPVFIQKILIAAFELKNMDPDSPEFLSFMARCSAVAWLGKRETDSGDDK